ncbi:DHA2 family efflux MFS transporter permease subunit [Geodermatophilus sp. DSM 44513]|uniref:DHA2 family efflux MFS transporter permease subunit n=1 Tax=Geodermatophilus sp. DSM 44513 TaxID=1528104 RepID=UPI001281BD1F|nr:DHA2 family efflux MFS transporter permease subunit [Geodermatophilus sp. DSM 44513]WNV77044.1 DHA2 family efflux MFS transporter permease subunit [Geodermatophilus sp. DSM 44513]
MPARAWRVLAVTAVAVFMGFLDVTIVNIAFPDLRASFPTTDLATLSWVLNGYGIVFAAALVPMGRFADRLGRRRVFLSGLVVFTVASAACGLAWDPAVLIAARVVQALGAAALVPASLALLLPEFPLHRRATATAVWGASGAVAAATGPALGGLLVAWGDWRWVFFVTVPIGLAALVPARRLLHETRGDTPDGGGRPDLLGAALLATAMGSLSLAIVQGPSWGWTSGGVLTALGAAAVLTVAFVVRSARHRAPVVDLRLFRVRSFAVANAGILVFSLGFYALLLCNVLYLTDVWGYGILRAGVALTPGPLTAAVTAVVAGRLADRFGQRVVAVPGGILFAVGAALLAASASRTPDYALGFLPATVLTGAGVGLTLSSFGSAAVAELPRTQFATGSAVTACVRQIGAVLGVAGLLALVGDTTADLGRFQDAWWAMAATATAAALLAAALGRVRARDVGTPASAAATAGAVQR